MHFHCSWFFSSRNPILIFILVVAGLAKAQADDYDYTSLSNGLVAYYQFNGNLNDAIGNLAPASNNGAYFTSDRFGNSNGALGFNGSQYAIISGLGGVMSGSTSGVTVSGWYYCNVGSPGFASGFIQNPQDQGDVPALRINVTSPNNYIQGDLGVWGVGPDLVTSTPFPTGSWHNITAVITVYGYPQYFLDGVACPWGSSSPTPQVGPFSFNCNYCVGTSWEQNHPVSNSGYLLSGAISGLRFYSRPLSATEVAALYKLDSMPPNGFQTNGLVAYFPFQGDLNDYSGNSNNLTNITSGITFGTDRFGNTNSALHIGSSIDQAKSANPIAVSGTSYRTVSMWVKLDNSNIDSNNSDLIEFGNPAIKNGGSFSLGIDHANGGDIYERGGYADLELADLGFPFLDSWHHLVYVYSGSISAAEIFIDGSLSTSTVPNQLNLTNQFDTAITPLYLGKNPYHGGKEGASISDLRIYNRALSPAEVTTLYNYENEPYSEDSGNWVSFLSSNLPTNSLFYSSLAANTNFASALANTFTSNPNIYGLFVGPQGPAGATGATGPQGQTGVFDTTVLTNTVFLQSLATNQVFINALVKNPGFLATLSQSLTSTNTNYGIASKAVQTISFATIPPLKYKPSKAITLTATSSAKLPITYYCANPAIGQISGDVLQLTGQGTTTITATQAGNQYYNSADATQSLVVH